MKNVIVFLLAVPAIIAGCNGGDKTPDEIVAAIPPPPVISYSVVKTYPHDTTSYTQGLEWHNNDLYEGSGDPDYNDPTKKAASKLAKVDLVTGKDIQKIGLTKDFFGEGITIFNGKIYQLTWKEHKVFVYDQKTFKKLKEFSWPFEGWGITHTDSLLIVSTGDSNLYFVNPETFQVTRTLGVTDNNGYVSNLNELEYVDGKVYANIYMTDIIVKTDPATGKVEGRLDFAGILQKSGAAYDPRTIDPGYVLNGIAYKKETKSFFITGKMWPMMFEIRLN